MDNPLLAFAGLAVLCGVCQWLAWRINLPSILFLLTAGVLVGPVFGLFDPDAFLGDLLFPFVSVAVAIILFEGGLTLRFSDIRGHGAVVTRLITIGVLLTWGLLSIAAHYLFGMPWALSLIFGSIVVVSGPTVVKPLLQSVRPTDRVGHVLNWEGILIDPIGVFLALLVFEAVLQATPDVGHIALVLAKLVLIGGAFGAAAGYATAFVLKRYLVPDFLVNVIALVIVIAVFSAAETLQHESGLLAVTIMGVWLANTRGLHIEEILHFKEDLSVLLISGLFIVLASRIDIGLIPQYGWQILALLAIAQFIVRPANAWLCSIGSELSTRERLFLGWIAPRGIVAAAVSSVFVLRLEEEGVPMAELLVPLVFSMIMGTVVFQSLTSKALAGKLGISNPEPNGVLFFGANEIGLALATALRHESVKVMMSDTSWRNVSTARKAGFEAYHGNPTSGHAAENLDLQGIGKLIAVSSSRDANALAGMHFRKEFGSSRVFTLEGASDDQAYQRFDTANRNRANPLFDASLNPSRLSRLLREGEVRHLTLTEPKTDRSSPPDDAAQTSDEDRTEAVDETLGTSPEVIAQAGPEPEEDDGVDRQALETAERLTQTEDEVPASDRFAGDASVPDSMLPGGVAPGSKGAASKDREATRDVARGADEAADKAADDAAAGDAVGESTGQVADPSAGDTTGEPDPATILADDLPLFAIDPDDKFYIYGAGEKFNPRPGWRVIVLRERPAETPAARREAA